MLENLYRVTGAAPSRVCGRDVRAGDELFLPEQVAAYERDLGHLETVNLAAEVETSGAFLDPDDGAVPVEAEPADEA